LRLWRPQGRPLILCDGGDDGRRGEEEDPAWLPLWGPQRPRPLPPLSKEIEFNNASTALNFMEPLSRI